MRGVGAEGLIGREPLLARLADAAERAEHGDRVALLVSGEAGIGKTSLVRAATAAAAHRGHRVAWGSCPDTPGVPGFWPWTQVLGALIRDLGAAAARKLAGDDAGLLAVLSPALGSVGRNPATDRDRLLLLDATTRFLDAVTADAPVGIVLDDLHWADDSTLALFDFVARSPVAARLCLIGCFRPDELRSSIRDRLLSAGEVVPVPGIDADAVHRLMESVRNTAVDPVDAAAVAARTQGHPFFVREIALLPPGGTDQVPAAASDLIARRIGRLSDRTRRVLEAIALLGTTPRPDVLARALELDPTVVADATREAVAAGVLLPDGPRFSHDLLREAVVESVPAADRVALHRALGEALTDRAARAGDVVPTELARQFVAAVAVDGPDRALQWALAAAAADRDALAFDEAAGQLRRLRAAVADAGLELAPAAMFEVLLLEADALARAGEMIEARGLLRAATDLSRRTADPDRIARAALAVTALGARFAVRRDDVIADLTAALDAVRGIDDAREAEVCATLARELQHSVAADRPRAGPLSEHALRLARKAGDPATLLASLFARHDVLWAPGTAPERAELAREIVAVADACGDPERRADGLLLLATALLEEGSPAFEPALDEALALLDGLGQPRHRYLALTRRACLALLRGDLDAAEDLIERAAELGDRIREPDTGNVRMSQRIELVRARGEAAELLTFAAEAVAHWTGVPIHAHAVAAGFCARGGDLAAAERHLRTVADLGGWRAETSYLRAVFLRELAEAAIAVGDRELCADLVAHTEPLAATCGVNASVVAFAGSWARTAGRLAATLGDAAAAATLLERAAATHRRLGATTFDDAAAGGPRASFHRVGTGWQIGWDGESALLRPARGLTDLAQLLAAAGREVHVLDLMDAADRSGPAGPVADAAALRAYRRRLAELEDSGNSAPERAALVAELSRLTDRQGRARNWANSATERARKAVSARVRDAIRRIEGDLPDLAAHLDRTVVTGNYCRYRTDEGVEWDIRVSPGHSSGQRT